MKDEGSLGEEEEHEPRPDEGERVARFESLQRLGQDVEERNGNDDAAGQGNRRHQFERREDGDPRERYGDPVK